MSTQRVLILTSLLLVSGCQYHAQERADQALCEVVAHPFDVGAPLDAPEAASPDKPAARTPPTANLPAVALDVQTTALMQAEKDPEKVADILKRFKIPDAVPGSETPPIDLPKDPVQRRAAIERLYPPLPPLPQAPTPLPGPDGCPFTLAALQSIAAANSPTLRQAAANVELARGNYIQAKAYPNPTVGYQFTPSSDGSTPSLQGPYIDQVIQTAGKLKLAAAAAEMDLKNAELALKRARSDLSTNVRNAYYAVLVAKETVRVNQGLSRFTDEVYLIQAELLENGFAAPYEPASLRAQAYTNRLALNQAIQTYIYSWKQLVATAGLRQLPLSEVAGRVDRAIPFYDYDTVLAHVLHSHTDMLTAYNGVEKARYNLKAAQVTPIPNVEFNVGVLHDYALAPKQVVPTATVSLPLPIWNQNKGGIIAAEAALVTASEEPHRVETVLTNSLATNYLNYKNNLEALEYYRRFILPDQVRAYRGVYERRRIDPNSAFGDLVQAQQTLATNVQTYLGILSTVWTSVVSVADLLQTDDLFQLGHPQELPELPDLDHLPVWMCHHPCEVVYAPGDHGQVGQTGMSAGQTGMSAPPAQVPADGQQLPAPRPVNPPQPQAEEQRPTPAPGNLPERLVAPAPTAAE